MQRTSDERYSRAVDACNACANVCEWCASTALQQINAPEMGRTVAVALDCAEVCRLTANLLLRASPVATAICLACIETCEACAEQCARLAGLHFERCVARCGECIQECWPIVSQSVETDEEKWRARKDSNLRPPSS